MVTQCLSWLTARSSSSPCSRSSFRGMTCRAHRLRTAETIPECAETAPVTKRRFVGATYLPTLPADWAQSTTVSLWHDCRLVLD